MAPRSHTFVWAIFVLCLISTAISDDVPVFPTLDELEIDAFATEVQITDSKGKDTAYALEYYDTIEHSGHLQYFADNQIHNIYYYNETYEILDVNAVSCMVWKVDESQYGLEEMFPRWLLLKPLVIGPSAALFYAQTRRGDIDYESNEDVRNIPCEKFALDIRNSQENYTVYYYFARSDWATPYKKDKLRVPVRIHVLGSTSKNVDGGQWAQLDVVNDYAFFKPTVADRTVFQPPVGLGCNLRTKSKSFPEFPSTFQYSAELVDLWYKAEHPDVDVNFERVWYDGKRRLARFDIYQRTTSSSSFQDYNTGVMFQFNKEQDCKVKPNKNAFFEMYDLNWAGRFKTPEEVLHLEGKFYDMGQRDVRGLTCDTYESVELNYDYNDMTLHRFVVTAYFVEDSTVVAVNSELESRIPILIMLTGWKNATAMAFQLQYNVFAFSDSVWPEMYQNFNIDKCYPKVDTKTQFILILKAAPKYAALMEDQNDFVVEQLRMQVAAHANVPEWRIAFLKVDYRTTGVYANGLMLERPPAILQFEEIDSGDVSTRDKHIKIADAGTLDDCADACVDAVGCKGIYFCNEATCIIKSEDPTATHSDDDKPLELGNCDEYIRDQRDTTNEHNTRLKQALENLEKAVLNGSIPVIFKLKNGEGEITVADIVVGDGPYIGVDTGDKPYSANIKFRRIDSSRMTSKVYNDVELLHSCYRKCQALGSGCSSFSFCSRSKDKNRKSDQPKCVVSSELYVRGKTSDLDLIEDEDCDVYDLRYLEYFTKYPEEVTFVPGYRDIAGVETAEECAKNCRFDGKTDKEDKQKCRGFEYCSSVKKCSLHEKHILDLKPGEKGSNRDTVCIHYAARFIADYADLGTTLVEDSSNVRYQLTLEQCARICSEELGDSCKSFNFCPTTQTSCELSGKVLQDGVTTAKREPCTHYEKRSSVTDWSSNKAGVSTDGYTKKGFTGLVIGMLALGLIIGALGFVGYSCIRSRKYGEGMSVRFMKQDA